MCMDTSDVTPAKVPFIGVVGKKLLANFVVSVIGLYLPLNDVQHRAVVQHYKTHCIRLLPRIEARKTASFQLFSIGKDTSDSTLTRRDTI